MTIDRYPIPSGKVFGSKPRRSDREVFDLLGVKSSPSNDEVVDSLERDLREIVDGSNLTPLEREVFVALAYGTPLPGIARMLDVSKARVAAVVRKLNDNFRVVDEADSRSPSRARASGPRA